MYRLMKYSERGFYHVDVRSDEELIEHLVGAFRNTTHRLIAVIRLTPVVSDAAINSNDFSNDLKQEAIQ